ncbi:MAG TPA: hypothetical protein VGL00_23200, partial [Terracidiphilus sp.]
LAKGKRKDPRLHFHGFSRNHVPCLAALKIASTNRTPVILTLTLSLRRESGRIRGCIFMVSAETTFHV